MPLKLHQPVACITHAGLAIPALVVWAKDHALEHCHSLFVQQSLLILSDACSGAIEKLYCSFGALVGIAEGLWQALR